MGPLLNRQRLSPLDTKKFGVGEGTPDITITAADLSMGGPITGRSILTGPTGIPGTTAIGITIHLLTRIRIPIIPIHPMAVITEVRPSSLVYRSGRDRGME